MSEIRLTRGQLSQIQRDMYEKDKMLSDEEINALAQKANQAIHLPLLNEEKEFGVFVKLIKIIDSQLYRLLPNEYYGLLKDMTDGVSKEEAIKLEERITPLINNVVNIPILTEKQEKRLISMTLGLIISAMVAGYKLDTVKLKD